MIVGGVMIIGREVGKSKSGAVGEGVMTVVGYGVSGVGVKTGFGGSSVLIPKGAPSSSHPLTPRCSSSLRAVH